LLPDAEQMQRAFQQSSLIRLQSAVGDPPELYQVEYHINGLARGPAGKPVPQERHLVEIQLTSEYPRQSPRCGVLTPIFHPNIDPATICVGDHWTAGERLVDLVIRIGEMIAYQAYNIKSPLDGEAAMWADLNRELLPIDRRDLDPSSDTAANAIRPSPRVTAQAVAESATMVGYSCPCGQAMQGQRELIGKLTQCPACGQRVAISDGSAQQTRANADLPLSGAQPRPVADEFDDRPADANASRARSGRPQGKGRRAWPWVPASTALLLIGGGVTAVAVALMLLAEGSWGRQKAVPSIYDLAWRITRDDKAKDKPIVDIDLRATKVTDASLKELAELNQLQHLELRNTQVSDAGLKHLAGLQQLKGLRLFNTQVTQEGEATLKKALPKLQIVR
jgi:ubiquitin-protein ligase